MSVQKFMRYIRTLQAFLCKRPSLTNDVIAIIIIAVIIVIILRSIASRFREFQWFRHLSNCSELGHI